MIAKQADGQAPAFVRLLDGLVSSLIGGGVPFGPNTILPRLLGLTDALEDPVAAAERHPVFEIRGGATSP